MATFDETYLHTNSTDVLYAKANPLSATPTWGFEVDVATQNVNYLKQYQFADLERGFSYVVFVRAGATPANTDTALAVISEPLSPQNIVDALNLDATQITQQTNAAAAALDASKTPRKATAIAAGAAVTETWTVVTDTSGTLVITKVIS